MSKTHSSNMWEALSRIYLTTNEITETLPKENKKKFINIIKKRFFENIWEKMKNFGEKNPPFLKEPDFPLLCCRAIIKETEAIQWGHLEIFDTHFIIHLNKNLSDARKRTVLAHELGHTFLYDLQSKPIVPLYIRERSLDLLSPNIYSDDEGFVYEIGRFLLAPTKVLPRFIPQVPSLESFLTCCSLFQTTKDVMAKRLLWDIYNFDTEEKFWRNALLVFFPIHENGDLCEIPKGNKYIYRGANFKNFHIEKYWEFIVPLLSMAFSKPDTTIKMTLTDKVKLRYLLFKNSKIIAELKYIPKDRRIYILFSQ